MRRYLLLFAAAAIFFAQAGIAGTSDVAVALAAHSPTPERSAGTCSFQPPAPVLLPNSYSGQTLERQSENRVTEKAQLHNGLRIEIRQSACVDFLTTEFTLIVPRDRNLQLDQNGWIELARTTIAGLKTLKPADEDTDLNDFLSHAEGLRPHNGIVAVCKDGSDARPGECSWDSLGGFVFSVKRTEHCTRISVTKYLSG
jgi:hypothetical protein